ncbi:hypothetical protein C8T65DRAFT_644715 [Cerioporus squamosus]|nr:hypothetical protein C8T65DRAFT_644715 [Cerioporus squamosus]
MNSDTAQIVEVQELHSGWYGTRSAGDFVTWHRGRLPKRIVAEVLKPQAPPAVSIPSKVEPIPLPQACAEASDSDSESESDFDSSDPSSATPIEYIDLTLSDSEDEELLPPPPQPPAPAIALAPIEVTTVTQYPAATRLSYSPPPPPSVSIRLTSPLSLPPPIVNTGPASVADIVNGPRSNAGLVTPPAATIVPSGTVSAPPHGAPGWVEYTFIPVNQVSRYGRKKKPDAELYGPDRVHRWSLRPRQRKAHRDVNP